MKLVIIESPYAGNVARHEVYVKRCMLDSLRRGEVPFASHLLYTQILDDSVPSDRRLGIGCGFEITSRSDLTAVYTDYGISSGMTEGIEIAKRLNHKIELRTIGRNP